jgi:ParB/RepB/Spo0J family partition protein
MSTKFDGIEVGRADILKFPPEELDKIVLSLNLREDLGDLADFKRGLAQDSQLQPGLVRRDTQGRPVLVAGYRRLTAIREINQDPSVWGLQGPMSFLAKMVSANADEALILNLRENLDRKELSPIDLAFAARELRKLEWDNAKIAGAMRVSPSRVSQLMALLELPSRLRKLVHQGRAPESLARNLRGLSEDEVGALVDLIEQGRKPAEVLKISKDKHRSKGEKQARTRAELMVALDGCDDTRAFNLKCWLEGDPTVDLSEVFKLKKQVAA